MNPIDLLMQDHRRVEQLFADLQTSESATGQEDIFQTLQTELFAHAEAEEQAFYPALKGEVPELVEKALQEHAEVKEMLTNLLDADLEDENFDAQMAQVMESVQAHVSEEEKPGGLMEIALQKLSKQALSDMAQHIMAVRRQVQSDMAA